MKLQNGGSVSAFEMHLPARNGKDGKGNTLEPNAHANKTAAT